MMHIKKDKAARFLSRAVFYAPECVRARYYYRSALKESGAEKK